MKSKSNDGSEHLENNSDHSSESKDYQTNTFSLEKDLFQRKAQNEKQQIDKYQPLFDFAKQKYNPFQGKLNNTIENMEKRAQNIFEDDYYMIKFQYEPKVDQAKQRVQALSDHVEQQKAERAAREEIKILKRQITQQLKTKEHLDSKIQEFEELIADEHASLTNLQQHVSETRKELSKYNKSNLQMTYQIEDVLDQIDEIKNQQDPMFMTSGPDNPKFTMKKHPSYATLQKDTSKADLVVQNKIKKALNEDPLPSRQNLYRPRSYKKQRDTLDDQQQLTQEQQDELDSIQEQINTAQKQLRQYEKQGFKVAQDQYEQQKEAIELEEFYDQCLKASSKEVIRLHESHPTNLESTTNSYLLELLRKKYKEKEQKASMQGNRLKTMQESQQYGAIDRYTKSLIYHTIKQISNTAKEDKKKANLMNIDIKWTEFQRFTPLQVIGLMLLRDDVNTKMKRVFFQNAIRDNFSYMSQKISDTDNNNNNQNNAF